MLFAGESLPIRELNPASGNGFAKTTPRAPEIRVAQQRPLPVIPSAARKLSSLLFRSLSFAQLTSPYWLFCPSSLSRGAPFPPALRLRRAWPNSNGARTDQPPCRIYPPRTYPEPALHSGTRLPPPAGRSHPHLSRTSKATALAAPPALVPRSSPETRQPETAWNRRVAARRA